MTIYQITTEELSNIYQYIKKYQSVNGKTVKYSDSEINRFLSNIFLELQRDVSGNVITTSHSYLSHDVEKIAQNPTAYTMQPFALFPFPLSQHRYYHPKLVFTKLAKPLFKTVYNYFLTKNIDIVLEMQKQNIEDWNDENHYISSTYRVENNENYFYMIEKQDYDIKKEKNIFVETMDRLFLLPTTRVIQTYQLIGIKAALKNDDDKSMALSWLKSFLNQNVLLHAKHSKPLDEIKSLFGQDFLKEHLTQEDVNRIERKDNEYILEKQVDATNFVIQFKKINKDKKVQLYILENNFESFINIVKELMPEGYVDSNYAIKYNVGYLTILYEKNNLTKVNNVEKLFKIYLSEVINYTELVGSQPMLDNLKKSKSKIELYNKLSNEEKEVVVSKRNKI